MGTESGSILIVDDDEKILETFETLLSVEGYSIETAADGAEAIAKSNVGAFNLALVDIVLPDMHGTQLLPQLKETTPRMRKIIVTGYPTLDNAVEALNHGADAYVIKPVHPDKLLELVREQMASQREEKEVTVERIEEFIETREKELEQEEGSREPAPGNSSKE
jgi:DNA-binding NtrC family response regulator